MVLMNRKDQDVRKEGFTRSPEHEVDVSVVDEKIVAA
jgi:hypothetical protein